MVDIKSTYERNGYVVLPGALNTGLNALIRAAIDSLCAAVSRQPEQWTEDVLYQDACRPAQLAHLPEADRAEARAQIYIIGNLARHVPEVRQLLLSQQLLGIAEQALGEPACFHFSNVTLRAARLGSANAWHRDFPNQFCCAADDRQLRLVVCLDGMSEKQGALRVVAGSHRWTDEQWQLFKSERGDGVTGEARTIECPPGSVVVVGGRIAHAVLPNVSEFPRANVIAQYGACSNPLTVGSPELETPELIHAN